MSETKSAQERIREIQAERSLTPKVGFFGRAARRGKSFADFIRNEMWRLYESEVTGVWGFFVRVLQILYITIVEFVGGMVSQKASSLTYVTLLSMVPLLVVLLSVATGFGLQESVQRQLFEYFPAQQQELTRAFNFAEVYLSQIQSSVFIGIGVGILLYAVSLLLMNIETVFNTIWHISKPRSIPTQILTYLATFLVVPILVSLSAGLNVANSFLSSVEIMGANISLTPVTTALTAVVPYLVWIFLFTILYLVVPNTRVRFLPALISGTVAGIAFQLFQLIYISGQIWVSKYNSIYGSFAAIPLLMLFTNFSWMICLFGAQLCYSIQNVRNYAFKSESQRVSRRYRDFAALVLMKQICRAYAREGTLYDSDLLSKETALPLVVVDDTLDKLIFAKLLTAHPVPQNRTVYLPAIDLDQITVRKVLSSMDRLGSENFRTDLYGKYAPEWALVRKLRPGSAVPGGDTLLKDL